MEVDASAVRENQGIVRRHTGGTGSSGKTVLHSKKVKVLAYATMKLQSLFRLNKIKSVKLTKYAASASQNCTRTKAASLDLVCVFFFFPKRQCFPCHLTQVVSTVSGRERRGGGHRQS